MASVAVRWHRIARPAREMLRAQISSLETELHLVEQKPELNQIASLLAEGKKLVEDRGVWWSAGIADVLFWSRGKELTGWLYVHQAESHMARFLARPTVVARLEINEPNLRSADDPRSLALANSIHAALAPPTQTPLDRLQALLSEALALNYESEDTSFSDLANWQNKAAWLVLLGLFLIVVLAALDPPHSIFLLVGALGGLLSRMSRSLNRSDLPTDYGADWTTLFLSPVAGALGAWSGILISQLAAQLAVLGEVFRCRWEQPYESSTLAIALLFGFSEQLLDTIFEKVTEKTDSNKASASNPPPRPGAAQPSATGTGEPTPGAPQPPATGTGEPTPGAPQPPATGTGEPTPGAAQPQTKRGS
ncbi:MAG: hypothetical protein E6K30_14905 [Gammaproteobacteria bacterium]|nr:MAG: hypothetical protein E6K30_14905 [Gammaproteobacteria bacterium]